MSRTYRLQRMAPVALAAFMALGQPAKAWAQAADTRALPISLAAQPLDSALNALSAATGAVIAFSPALVSGKMAPAVSGPLTPGQALNRLLAGSGLVATQDGASFVIRSAPTSSSTLPAVTVSAAGIRDTLTEGSPSYAARYASTATRLELSPRETPQTMSVVTRQQMDDFGLTSVDDALKTASGVFVYERGNLGSYYFSRGFYLQPQYDGVSNPIGISNDNKSPIVDSAFLDHVEVLQGASGLLSGAGYPGGTINLVRKRPTHNFQAQAEVQLGSWNQRRLMADLSAPLVESGRVRARIVALADNADSFVNHAFNDRRGIYGVIEADLSPTTVFSASVQHQKDSGRDHSGVPYGSDGSDLGLSRSAFFANPWARNNKDYTHYTVGLEQKLPLDWRLKTSYTRGDAYTDQPYDSWLSGTLNNTTGNGLSIYQARLFSRSVKYDTLNTFATGPLTLFGRKHELVIGASLSDMRDQSVSTGYVPTPINVYGFDPLSLPTPTGGSPYSQDIQVDQKGLYGVGRFNLADSLKLITGARLSWYRSRNLVTGVTDQKETAELSPYAGLIYDINAQYSAYASYSDIFNPQSQRGADGRTIKPVVGSNYELGIKGELLQRKLNVAAALFRLDQKNLAQQDTAIAFDRSNACGGWCYLAADKVTSEGIDLSANGEIRPGWNLAAGYTYVHSQYATGRQDGQRYMPTLPQHSLSLAASVRLAQSPWTLGANLRSYSSIYNATYHIRRGNLTLVGVNARYQINRQSDLHVVVDNLLDKRYYATVHNLWYSPFGEPRKVSVSYRYRY